MECCFKKLQWEKQTFLYQIGIVGIIDSTICKKIPRESKARSKSVLPLGWPKEKVEDMGLLVMEPGKIDARNQFPEI